MLEQRNLAGSLILGANDDARLATGTGGLDMPAGPGLAGSYALAFDVYPTALAAGPLTLAAMGPRHAEPATWYLFQQAGEALTLQIYDGAGVGNITGSACDFSLKVNKWHRIVGIWYRSATAGQSVVGLYCNAKLVGLLYGLASTWLASAQTFFLGNGPDYASTPGYYSNVRCWKGSEMPRPGSLEALRAVEDNYFHDAPLIPTGGAATYELDGALTDDVSGNAALTLVGAGAVLTAAYPGGTPLRPWEVGADYQP